MNRRLCVWTAALGMGLAGSLAFAQDAATPTTNPAAIAEISTATKGRGDIGPDQQAEIKAFITPLVGMVVTDDPAGQKGAAADLVKEAPGAANGYTAQYLDAYAAALNQQILITLKTQPPVRARLNLAIVAAQVAKQTLSNQLEPTAEALLNDPSEAVALWGMKTAKYVLPSVLAVQVPGKISPLLGAMESTGLKFPGPVLDETYDGLTLGPLGYITAKSGAQYQAAIKIVIPVITDLLQKRNAMWQGGAIPKDPLLDATGTNFLVNTTVWGIEGQMQGQQQKTIVVMHNMLSNAAVAFGTVADKTELQQLIGPRLGGGFMSVFSGDDSITVPAKIVRNINVGTPPAQVIAASNALNQAIEALTLMQGVQFGPAPVAPAPAAPVTQGPTSRATSATSPGGTLAGIK